MSARIRILGWTVVTFLTVSACRLSDRDYATIDAWLLCDDCRNDERYAVRAIGRKAVHTLDQALVRPSPGRVAAMQAQFRQTYRRRVPPPVVSESAYVAGLLANYVALYQRRAATSLGDIGGSRAIKALRRARANAAPRGYRDDVVRTIDAVLGQATLPPFTGTVRPRVARWGSSVSVIRDPTGPPWDGNEGAALYGSPPVSLAVSHWPVATDSFSFVAQGDPGEYALLITGLGPPADTQVTTLTIGAAPHPTHTPQAAPIATAATFPQVIQIAMGFTPGDTTDYLKFTPESALVVNAIATATPDAPTLTWYHCPFGPLATLGPPEVMRGLVVNPAGSGVGGAVVTVPGTALAAVTNPTGRFTLGPIPAFATAGGMVTVRITRIGYQVFEREIQAGADSVLLTIAPAPDGPRLRGVRTQLPAGTCRLLELAVPSGAPGRVVILRLIAS